MSGTEHPEVRLSDADREQAVARLNDAVGEGRLTLGEFEERVDQVLRSRVPSELTPLLADLPAGQSNAGRGSAVAPDYAELRANVSTIKRTGGWAVPRKLRVHSKAGTVKLDLTDATIGHPVVEVELDSYAGSTTLVLPRGATVNVDQVESGSAVSSTKVRKVPRSAEPTGRPHVEVTGKQYAGSLTVRHQRRFLRWRW